MGTVLIAATLILCLFLWSEFHDYQDRQKGNPIIEKIEHYRNAHGRYPASFSEIGVAQEEGGPFYMFDDRDNSFRLWFGRGLGESYEYDSRVKTWSDRD